MVIAWCLVEQSSEPQQQVCLYWKVTLCIICQLKTTATSHCAVYTNSMKQFHEQLFTAATNLDGLSDTAHLRRTPANSDTTQQRTNWFGWYLDSGWSSYESSRSVKCASPTWWHGNCSCKPRVFTIPMTSAGSTAPGWRSGSRSNRQQRQFIANCIMVSYNLLT